MIAILNPRAANGNAGKKHAALEAALRAAGLGGEVWQTEAPGHGVALARQAAAEAEAVLAVGGDGTIHEVCQGLIASERSAHLGVIPLGTGNDFVKMLGMARDLETAARQLASAVPTPVDYGLVHWDVDGEPRRRAFVNAVGMGFDAYVAADVDAFKRLPGVTGYVAAVVRSLWRWQTPQARISGATTSGGPASVLYEGPLLLVTAGNGVCSGGSFYLTPRASITDGLLDVCLVAEASPWRILRILPRALKGRHEREPEVYTARLHRLHVTAEAGLPIHADGEIVTRCACVVEVEVMPGGLSVLMPAR